MRARKKNEDTGRILKEAFTLSHSEKAQVHPLRRITSATTTLGQTTKTLVSGLSYRLFGGPAHIENGTGGVINNQSGECGCLEVANPDPYNERQGDKGREVVGLDGSYG